MNERGEESTGKWPSFLGLGAILFAGALVARKVGRKSAKASKTEAEQTAAAGEKEGKRVANSLKAIRSHQRCVQAAIGSVCAA